MHSAGELCYGTASGRPGGGAGVTCGRSILRTISRAVTGSRTPSLPLLISLLRLGGARATEMEGSRGNSKEVLSDGSEPATEVLGPHRPVNMRLSVDAAEVRRDREFC